MTKRPKNKVFRRICRFFIAVPILTWKISYSQTMANLIPPSNVNYSGLEKNILFYANARYQVTQTGAVQLNLATLFDGSYAPSYTSQAVDSSQPTTITISNLPNIHTQNGAYVGWSTRGYPAKRFKIEGYNSYSNPPGWVMVADINNNTSYDYMVQLPRGSYTQLRFTFFEGRSNQGGKLGISELFFLHNEAAQAYEGLLVKYQPDGNVLIGKHTQTNHTYKLDVKGNIRADKVVVNTTGADYVFNPAFSLLPMDSLRKFIAAYHHLPDIPSASRLQVSGLDVGAMQKLQLQKIEEMTLYLLQKDNEIKALRQELHQLKRMVYQETPKKE